jgi:hypothetical protein
MSQTPGGNPVYVTQIPPTHDVPSTHAFVESHAPPS